MKTFAGCLTLAVLAATSGVGCNQASHQSAAKIPSVPNLIGNTDKLESQLSVARLQEHQGQLRDATDRYQQLAAKNPENATIPHRLAIIESKAGRHDQANAHFRRSLELDPHNAEVLADWGYALFLQGKLGESEAVLRLGLTEAPGDARIINNLALTLGHAGKSEESLALFRQVSGEAAAWVNLGYVHVNLGQGEKAAECFGRALTIDDQLESAAQALVQIADLQQEAYQRASRNGNIASADPSNQKTPQDSAVNAAGQVTYASAAFETAGTSAPTTVTHAGATARSALKQVAPHAGRTQHLR